MHIFLTLKSALPRVKVKEWPWKMVTLCIYQFNQIFKLLYLSLKSVIGCSLSLYIINWKLIKQLQHESILKLKLAINETNTQAGSSFEHTLKGLRHQCNIQSVKVIGLLILEKTFKGFSPYMGIVTILVMLPRHVNKLLFPWPREAQKCLRTTEF